MTRRSISTGLLSTIPLLWAGLIGAEPAVGSVDSGWRLDFPVYLTAMAFHVGDGEETFGFETLAASAELYVSRDDSPWAASVFLDQRVSTSVIHDDATIIGAALEYTTRYWDTAAYAFVADRPGHASEWYFGTRVRYRFRPAQKVGAELIGGFDEPSESIVLLGYYNDITPSLTLQLSAGTSMKSSHDYVARTQLVWQLN